MTYTCTGCGVHFTDENVETVCGYDPFYDIYYCYYDGHKLKKEVSQ